MPNPVDLAFPNTGSGSRQAIVDLFKNRVALSVNSVAELRGNDFTGHAYLRLVSTNSLYRFEALSTAADDGSSVIHDSTGNRFHLAETLPSLASHIVEGVPDNGLGTDGQLAFDVTNKRFYLKETGAWVLKSTIENGAAGAAGAGSTGEGIEIDFLTLKSYREVGGIRTSLEDDLSSIATITRPDAKWVWNAEGVLEQIASGTVAHGHTPFGGYIGAIFEPAVTNYVQYSRQIDNAYWTKTRGSITANAVNDPDGTLTADQFVEDTTASNSHSVNRSITPAGGGWLQLCCLFKPVGDRDCVLWMPGQWFTDAADRRVHLRLAAGYAYDILGTLAADNNFNMQKLWDGWWSLGIRDVAAASPAAGRFYILAADTADADGDFTYTGDGVSGFYISRVQVKNTWDWNDSFIDTTSATVTRAADTLSFAVADLPDLTAGGTILAEVTQAGLGSLINFNDVTADNRVLLSGSVTGLTLDRTSGGAAETQQSVSRRDGEIGYAFGTNKAVLYGAGASNQSLDTAALPVSPTVLEIAKTGRLAIRKLRVSSAYKTPDQAAGERVPSSRQGLVILDDASGDVRLDVSKANSFLVTRTGDINLSVVNLPASGEVSIRVKLINDGTGGHDLVLSNQFQNIVTFSSDPDTYDILTITRFAFDTEDVYAFMLEPGGEL